MSQVSWASLQALSLSRGLVEILLGHPLDYLKTRSQARPAPPRVPGLLALYRGLSFNLARHLFKSLYRDNLRGLVKMLALENRFDRQQANLLVGFIMATCDVLLQNPFERIKVFMMTSLGNQTLGSQLAEMMGPGRQLGGLNRGLRANYLRALVSWSSYLLIEEEIYYYFTREGAGLGSAWLRNLAVGVIGGVVNVALVLPLDCAKTRIQMSSSTAGESVLAALRGSWREGGLKGLYAGWQYRLVHYVLVGVVQAHYLPLMDRALGLRV